MNEYIVRNANACCVCVYVCAVFVYVWDISTTGRDIEYIACIYY